jgi:hypothetical protein
MIILTILLTTLITFIVIYIANAIDVLDNLDRYDTKREIKRDLLIPHYEIIASIVEECKSLPKRYKSKL